MGGGTRHTTLAELGCTHYRWLNWGAEPGSSLRRVLVSDRSRRFGCSSPRTRQSNTHGSRAYTQDKRAGYGRPISKVGELVGQPASTSIGDHHRPRSGEYVIPVPTVGAHSSAYRILTQNDALIFPERGQRRMDYRVQSTYEILQPIRFFPRSSQWSGAGVQGYPWVRAFSDDNPLVQARVHGRPFWSEGQRCYLIDLGRDVQPGEELTLLTQAMYVDEVGSFQTYAGFRAPHLVKSLKLTCAFKQPPSEAFYDFSSDDGDATEPRPVPISAAFGLSAFSVYITKCQPGVHRIFW